MKSWRFCCGRMLLLPFVFLVLTTEPVFPQAAPSGATNFKAKVDAAALALAGNARFKGLSRANRQARVEFVVGNMLFTLLHELAHGAILEMALPVLGKEEDAADSFAATRLIEIGSEFSDQAVAEAARGSIRFRTTTSMDSIRCAPSKLYALLSARMRTSFGILPARRNCRRIAKRVAREIMAQPQILGIWSSNRICALPINQKPK
jgi:hypothetical protein